MSQQTIRSRVTDRLENITRKVTYPLAASLARAIVRRGQFSGLRANLAVIHDLPLESSVLEQKLVENIHNAFVCYVDFFIIACRGPEAIEAACELDPESVATIERHLNAGRGVVLVAAHMSSLDVFMLAMSKRFPEMQALTMPSPPLNTRLMNRLRRKYGMVLSPISPTSLRSAIRHLRSGGIVGIAADVPTPHGAERNLFGKPCKLPMGHTRLANATGSALVVGVSRRVGPGKYYGFGTEIPTERGEEDDWAESTLQMLEAHIEAQADEWFMPPPLWDRAQPAPVVLFQHKLPPTLTSEMIQG